MNGNRHSAGFGFVIPYSIQEVDEQAASALQSMLITQHKKPQDDAGNTE